MNNKKTKTIKMNQEQKLNDEWGCMQALWVQHGPNGPKLSTHTN